MNIIFFLIFITIFAILIFFTKKNNIDYDIILKADYKKVYNFDYLIQDAINNAPKDWSIIDLSNFRDDGEFYSLMYQKFYDFDETKENCYIINKNNLSKNNIYGYNSYLFIF